MNENCSDKKETLKDVKARKRQDMQCNSDGAEFVGVHDPYENAIAHEKFVKGLTGLSYNVKCVCHECDWDFNHPECSLRLTTTIWRIKELGLEERCIVLENTIEEEAIVSALTILHSEEHAKNLKAICRMNRADREAEASRYDSVYFGQSTFVAACDSLNCALDIVMGVASGKLYNGLALCRPPGHHARANTYCGYCYFNNVAIAAEMCIKRNFAKRILIVDYDVHHGDGIQKFFYGRKDVLYFSIHRYDYGMFWPHLEESNFNMIGHGDGFGYNINVPLNESGLGDDDYLAIIFNVLLPVAYEYNPDLVIVSGGYDAAIGCPEGRMMVTPGFYGHLIKLLSGLACGKIAVCLEGGYFIPSLAESVAMTLKALLNDPCPLLDPVSNVRPSVINTICDVRSALIGTGVWKCLKMWEASDVSVRGYISQAQYYGTPLKPPYDTRNAFPIIQRDHGNFFEALVDAYKTRYHSDKLGALNSQVCFVYDEAMLMHAPRDPAKEFPEKPERLHAVYSLFQSLDLDKRCEKLPIEIRDFLLYNVHEKNYLEKLGNLTLDESNDIYLNDSTNVAISTAVSGLLTIIDQIMSGKSISGLALIRPPGHHAEYASAQGFCLVNNVAIGAQYLIDRYHVERILILDFDVHHGNGTQKIFYASNNVLYISVHRYDDAKFFPASEEGNYDKDGEKCGKGFNVNIPLSQDKMGDSEYLAIMHQIILPIAYSYGPDVILLSAGFDAGINDPLGLYKVSPETFGHLVRLLQPLAAGRIILSLEGGYNSVTLSHSVIMCTKALLGDPVPMPLQPFQTVSPNAYQVIRQVVSHFQQYWPILGVNKIIHVKN